MKGRPKKYPEGRQRTESVLLRLSPRELEVLDEKWKLFGSKSREDFMRTMLLGVLTDECYLITGLSGKL